MLTLLVLRCRNIEASKVFYEAFGFSFVREKHERGPEHFASVKGEFVLELYPLKENEVPDRCRLGFKVPCLKTVLQELSEKNLFFPSPNQQDPSTCPFSLKDPDGRVLELTSLL